MRQLLVIFFVSLAIPVFSQDSIAVAAAKKTPDFAALDSLYREDQFYFSFTYCILQNKPEDFRQNKFSSGFTLGFLRDMPINKARTWAIAAGLGYSISNYNHNLAIVGNDSGYDYSVLPSDVAYDKNKFMLHYVEVPLELRWRTSVPETHKFWRVYTGFKLSYMVFNRYKYQNGDDEFSSSNNPDFNRLQYGAYIATGYNTWNLNVYYGFNPLFKSAELDGESIDIRTLNIGLMFYIL